MLKHLDGEEKSTILKQKNKNEKEKIGKYPIPTNINQKNQNYDLFVLQDQYSNWQPKTE